MRNIHCVYIGTYIDNMWMMFDNRPSLSEDRHWCLLTKVLKRGSGGHMKKKRKSPAMCIQHYTQRYCVSLRYVLVCIYTHIRMCIYIYIYVCNMCMYGYIYIYIHILYIHVYIMYTHKLNIYTPSTCIVICIYIYIYISHILDLQLYVCCCSGGRLRNCFRLRCTWARTAQLQGPPAEGPEGDWPSTEGHV